MDHWAQHLIDIAGTFGLFVTAIIAIVVGAGAFSDVQKGEAQSLSRNLSAKSPRVFSRRTEPVGFWIIIVTEVVWLLLGVSLLLLLLGGTFGLI